jgi:hypothetical protein
VTRVVAALAIGLAIAACTHGGDDLIAPSAPRALPEHREVAIGSPASAPVPAVAARPHRRLVPAEAFLRSYLRWFGGLAPLALPQRARGTQLFDAWADYLAALGLPDYAFDDPRASRSNAVMLATFGRLGEALCVLAATHDLDAHTPVAARVVFAFPDPAAAAPTLAEFTHGFDVLHRTFLGYPAALAPADRIPRYFRLYQQIAASHAASHVGLPPAQAAWATVCGALVVHPEAEVY